MTAIEKDIQNGVYQNGCMLPSIKELCAQYGAGYRPTRRALDALVSHGSIARERRGFRVRDLESLHYRNRIILLARGDHLGNLTETSPRMHEHLRALERECSRHHLRLEVYTYDFQESYLHPMENWREIAHNESARTTILGYIIWSISMRPESLRNMVLRLAGHERPISVLDEGGVMGTPPPSGQMSPLRVFTMAGSPAATRAVGRFLLRLGHNRIAFISPFGSALWSRNRLRGLLHAYRVAGHDDAVRAFVSDQSEVATERVAPDDISQTVDALIQGTSDQVLPLRGHVPLTRALKRLRWRLAAAVREELEHEALMALLRRAAREAGDATAWVGANDYVAVECLSFLRERQIRVPQQIAVVGLDDGPEAHLHKLTSYNFNGEGVMRAMVRHILDPHDNARDGQSGDPVEMEGQIVVRDTTSAAPKRTVHGQ